jgi:hypothetical protein
MADISYGRAVSAGFRVIGRRPWIVLGLAIAYLALAALPLIALTSQVLPDMIAAYRDIARQVVQHAPVDPKDVLVLQSKLLFLQPIIFVVQLVVHAVLMGAVFRAVLYPDESRWAYLRLSRRELWLGLTNFVLIVMGLVLSLTLLMCLGFGIGVAAAMAQHGARTNPAEVILFALIALGATALIAWLLLRLSLALPMSFAENRFMLYESWSLTKGQALKMFLVVLTLLVFALAIELPVSFVVRTVILNQVAHASSWRAFLHGSPSEVAARLTPVIIGYAAVGSVFAMALYTVLVAPLAEMYRQLTAAGEPAA